MVFIDRVKQILAERGQSGASMCMDLGLSRGFLAQSRRPGASPLGLSVLRISTYLSTSADYLLGITDERHPINVPEDRSYARHCDIFNSRRAQLLKEKNVSERKMIRELEMIPSTVWNWRKFHQIPVGETLIKLADYLNTSVDYLLGLTDEKRRGADGDEP